MAPRPPTIIFKGLSYSDALDEAVRERARWLENSLDDNVGCRVRLEIPYRRKQVGRALLVRLEVTSPGARPVVVNHELVAPAFARIAILQAFDAARRELQDADSKL